MLQAVRGTKDLFFKEAEAFDFIEQQAVQVSKQFGFTKVITPIIEFAEVFTSHLGETNDIVNKEMYTLFDRNGETLALRPEGTAPVVRMLLSNSLTHQLPLKFCYFGPMFRYERPQKGRQRQFYQFGVEHFAATTPVSDALLLLMGQTLLRSLNIRNYVLELNNIGSQEEQANFANLLKEYLLKYENELSVDSQKRLQTNPLRILDSKCPVDQKILEEAPKIYDNLSVPSQRYFEKILEYLHTFAIPYKVSNKLVRGLDYYTGLVFEFTSTDLGSQSAILAGGRYDKLVKNMGGPEVPAIGFAAGIERLMLLLNNSRLQSEVTVAILALSEDATKNALRLSQHLINYNHLILSFIEEGNNLAKKLKKANKINAHYALIIGEDEVKCNKVIIKNLVNGSQTSMDISNIENIVELLKLDNVIQSLLK